MRYKHLLLASAVSAGVFCFMTKRAPSPSFDDLFAEFDDGIDWDAVAVPGQSSSSSSSSVAAGSQPPALKKPHTETPSSVPSRLGEPRGVWFHLFEPQSSREIVGQAAACDAVRTYLASFNAAKMSAKDNHGASGPKGKKGASAAGKSKPALLLSGPPGIGKTLVANLVARECGFTPTLVDSLEKRNKATLEQTVVAGSKSMGIGVFLAKALTNKTREEQKPSPSLHRPIVIMDDVDALSGTSDRGAVSAVKTLLENRTVPVIFICNDRYASQVKTITACCQDVYMNAPPALDVARMARAKLAQHVAPSCIPSDAAILQMLETQRGDVRSLWNTLQMSCIPVDRGQRAKQTMPQLHIDKANLATSSVPGVEFMLKNRNAAPVVSKPVTVQESVGKDVASQIFRSTGCMLGSGPRRSLQQNMGAFFADYGIMPLMMAESYVNYDASRSAMLPEVNQRLPPEERLARTQRRQADALALAADAISLADVLSETIHSEENWDLLPTVGIAGCLYPAAAMYGAALPGTSSFMGSAVKFPQWFGKNSTFRANSQKLVNARTGLLETRGFVSNVDLLTNILPLVRQEVHSLLVKATAAAARGGKLGKEESSLCVQQALQVIVDSGLSKEQVDELPGEVPLDFTNPMVRAVVGAREVELRESQRRHLGGTVSPAIKAALTRAYNAHTKLRARGESSSAERMDVDAGEGVGLSWDE